MKDNYIIKYSLTGKAEALQVPPSFSSTVYDAFPKASGIKLAVEEQVSQANSNDAVARGGRGRRPFLDPSPSSLASAWLTTEAPLNPAVVARGFANDGQDVPAAGQVRSLTSTNNFINFCLTVNAPITNGKQITTGSCNPTPIGAIPSIDNMPSSKFKSPQNFATIRANTRFTVEMNIRGMQTGFFTNAQASYFAAPQQLNGQGQIQGHSHVVIEKIPTLESGQPTNPKEFAFFKGLNAAAAGGVLTADVTDGLPAGFYRLASINTASNHQPVIVPVAQHGSLDDMVYFTVTANGQPIPGTGNGNNLVGEDISSAPASTATASATASVSESVSATATASVSESASASVTASGTASASASATASVTGSASASATSSAASSTRVRGGKGGKGATSSAAASASTSAAASSSTAAATTSASSSAAASTSAAASSRVRGGAGKGAASTASSAAAESTSTAAVRPRSAKFAF
ncbi:hypothetical protein EST38_g11466 [Candolleomyces aberdarensis]|uniref:Uncharacterized protein n=1 Tax=Candolleomyces aberdarensis TaxID=2316362 RepID=A0A4Q2D6A1_9AGAR|nr:hypothetical protein EST38_g11466 [Candolleomyces aberdarensis]